MSLKRDLGIVRLLSYIAQSCAQKRKRIFIFRTKSSEQFSQIGLFMPHIVPGAVVESELSIASCLSESIFILQRYSRSLYPDATDATRQMTKRSTSRTRDGNTGRYASIHKSGSRRCSQCGITETSQWRTDPSGKIICNKCGMKSRRGKSASPSSSSNKSNKNKERISIQNLTNPQ